MIDFTRAFGSAWERMMVILFRPFDLNKWCVIGFSAFLAGLLVGGNGFNGFAGGNDQDKNQQNHTEIYHHHSGQFAQAGLTNPFNFGSPEHTISTIAAELMAFQVGVMFLFMAGIFAVVLGVLILFYWLGSRGQFLFLDNIVRNRAAISAPWTYYARPANGVFLFYLGCIGIGIALAVVLVLPMVFIGISPWRQHQWPVGLALVAIIILVLAYLALIFIFTCTLFFFREWGIPLMFRNNLTVPAALAQTWKLLCLRPGSALLFLLIRIALWIALVILCYAVCCATCCVAGLPYIGTVALLPVLVFIRCFSLDCLAQFGPEYDVFTVDVPPTAAAEAISPLPPPV